MVAVVIPNHLPHLEFLKEWVELRDVRIIVVQDTGEKPPTPKGFSNLTIFDRTDIENDLGEDAWIIPKNSSACRSYGYYKAWQENPSFIVTLDTDCYPEQSKYFIEGHKRMLGLKATLDWVGNNNLMPRTRGFPYLLRDKAETWLNNGLWSKVPDLDAPTWLQNLSVELPSYKESHVIPRYNFAPICGMNLSWRTELTPAMYFGIFGPQYGFDQYDDIWGGVLVKKVLDHLGAAARSGFPSVQHRKQSDVFVNLRKQTPGLEMNEYFWQEVQRIRLTKTSVIDCYEELISSLPDVVKGEPEGWTKKFKEAALIWLNLFKSTS